MRKFLFVSLLSVFVFASCSDKSSSELSQSTAPTEVQVPGEGTVITGHIRIKMKDELLDTKALGGFLSDYGVVSIRRTFPECGKFEERTRAEGLHLWYDVIFDPSYAVTKASEDLSSIDGVEFVEYVKKCIPTDAVTYPFNETNFSKQWNLFNDGSTSGYEAGCDINILPAWEITTGRKDVIVSIVDQGVQYNHEDLADNMWINELEYYGVEGVDDDENGFVDDIYGYNFVVSSSGDMYGQITPGNHGCNVAGIVSAVNNNGKGFCGIAGGNGSGNGVRLMSCQILDGASYSSLAIKYGADNGAVISNNSWKSNSTSLDESTKAAIDYFIKYAGFDENGNQTGPMAGGIVIFAAGNDNEDWCYPAMYEKVMAVSALGANFRKASYSNYGDWVDISAPGGDGSPAPYALIFNAYSENTYGGMGGTSQACPHISGIAALVVSKFGGEGFTNDMLWDKIINSAKNIDEYNSAYYGKLGAGLVDAYKALKVDDPTPPDKVESIWTSTNSNTINLKWLVPSDNSGKAYGFDIYYSKRSIEDLDLSLTLPEDVFKVSARTGVLEVNDTMKFSVSSLDFSTTYYFRIDCYDNSNNHAGLSNQVSQSTFINHPPVITPIEGVSVSLKAHESKTLTFGIYDQDEHEMTYDFSPGSNAAAASRNGDIISTVFIGKNANAGSYTASLSVSDPYSTSDPLEISYTILENHSPVVIKKIDDVVLSNKTETLTYNLAEYFSDEDGEHPVYSISSSSSSIIVEASIKDSILSVKGNWYGTTTITITASDALGASCSTSFIVLMRDGSQEIDVYPNPVSKTLYIRTGKAEEAVISIYSTSGSKVYSSSAQMTPFAPASIDVSGLSAGSYTVTVASTADDTVYKRNFVKL